MSKSGSPSISQTKPLAGWWWADTAAALVIAALAAYEGVKSWRGESCDSC